MPMQGHQPGKERPFLCRRRAINQAMGRVIRHRGDYGAIILADQRFQMEGNRKQISCWLRDLVKTHDTFGEASRSLHEFFEVRCCAQHVCAPGLHQHLQDASRLHMSRPACRHASLAASSMAQTLHAVVEVSVSAEAVSVTLCGPGGARGDGRMWSHLLLRPPQAQRMRAPRAGQRAVPAPGGIFSAGAAGPRSQTALGRLLRVSLGGIQYPSWISDGACVSNNRPMLSPSGTGSLSSLGPRSEARRGGHRTRCRRPRPWTRQA